MNHADCECKSLLSPREAQVLSLLAQGISYQLIALDLGISINTVKTRTRQIFKKLQARNSPHAVSRAIGLGIIPPTCDPPDGGEPRWASS